MKRTIIGLLLAAVSPVFAGNNPPGHAVATAHPLATQAGIDILNSGGNAFDAAVAISAALAVVEPHGSGIGGGGFWLLHDASTGKQVMIDGRETAPGAAHRDMYLNAEGDGITDESRNGPKAAGIPGHPAAMAYIAKNYGKLPLTRSMAAAIKHANECFTVDWKLARYIGWRAKQMVRWPGASEVFMPNGQPLAQGEKLCQKDLAKTLTLIAQSNARDFYEGTWAESLAEQVTVDGGIWQEGDLAAYKVIERAPIIVQVDGIKLISAAPPSSGGVAMAQALRIMRSFKWAWLGPVERQHVWIEALRHVYRDRAAWLGDTDFVDVPIARLLSPEYAASIRKDIEMDRATKSRDLASPTLIQNEGPSTTHFSVIDREGNRVSATLSINLPLGSAYMPKGFGFLLNDEMDDFSSRPGTPNAYGLVGGEANAIEPGKRMLSSMSPTFVETPERIAIIGTPGGSRIITMVLSAVMEFTQGNSALHMVSQPRIHHQYLPDKVFYESGALTETEQKALASLGHKLEKGSRRWGNMQVVIWDKLKNQLEAASDPRGIGQSVVENQR